MIFPEINETFMIFPENGTSFMIFHTDTQITPFYIAVLIKKQTNFVG